MAYAALAHDEHEHQHEHEHGQEHHEADGDGSPTPPRSSPGLFWAEGDATRAYGGDIHRESSLGSIFKNFNTSTAARYDMVEDDDDHDDHDDDDHSLEPRPPPAPAPVPNHGRSLIPVHLPQPRRFRAPASATATKTPSSPTEPASTTATSLSRPRDPIPRTASGRRIALRHPTPDLQTLQGAYADNIAHLERTAERLSMTSSIDEAIRDLQQEQKRVEGRRRKLPLRVEADPSPAQIVRQTSNASSIKEVMETARSGGYSPSGFMMSPNGSFTTNARTGRDRAASRSSRYGSRPEPELEGRPLDSVVTAPGTSPHTSRRGAVDEEEDKSPTLKAPVMDFLGGEGEEEKKGSDEERPTTSASTATVASDQAEKMFEDFDGVHAVPLAPLRPLIPQPTPSPDILRPRSMARRDVDCTPDPMRRVSAGNRVSMARPQSYADPSTGQQMVYYPAPVPMMLNLPQKLSKNPSSMARNKRRTQVLSTVPAAARQSAIWLPDVLETEDEPALREDDAAQRQEYIPQHQRMSMGGRRLTQDLDHLPPQLRANAFFELPGPNQVVEMKGQSAVATLDSILDASAHAPVSAFTDHAFAGHLGAEVYGRPTNRGSTQLLTDKPKKRTSSFNLLRNRRGSSGDVLEDATRRKSILAVLQGNQRHPIDSEESSSDDDDDDEEEETADEGEDDQGQIPDEIYRGPPTTLLAELQLRKQQQKHRTRPLAQTYPQGIHSTLLQLDAVAQVEAKTRKHTRVKLAWEVPSNEYDGEGEGDDEDVPLALLYSNKQQADLNRPMGLMERRDMEDNEPLSRRRDRLQGKKRDVQPQRASTMMNLSSSAALAGGIPHVQLLPDDEDEEETLAQRVKRLKAQGRAVTGLDHLPTARVVSGDFSTEMFGHLGVDLPSSDSKAKSADEPSPAPAPEQEETLGQRRARLQAEKDRENEKRKSSNPFLQPAGGERPGLKQRRSMADILQAHPAAGASLAATVTKPAGGLLGMHEVERQRRVSEMLGLNEAGYGSAAPKQQQPSGQAQQHGVQPGQQQQQQQQQYNLFGTNPPLFASPTMGVGAAAGYGTGAWGGAGGFGNQTSMGGGYQTPLQMWGMGMGGGGGFGTGAGGYNPGMGWGAGMNGMNGGFNGMGFGGMGMGMGGLGLNMAMQQPLNQGQIDMVERWRQSVMQ